MKRTMVSAYRAGWNRSASPDRADMDTEEDRYAHGRSQAQQDAWAAGWLDYAADAVYGTSWAELTGGAA